VGISDRPDFKENEQIHVSIEAYLTWGRADSTVGVTAGLQVGAPSTPLTRRQKK